MEKSRLAKTSKERERDRERQGEVTLKRHARLDEHAGRKSHCKAQQCKPEAGRHTLRVSQPSFDPYLAIYWPNHLCRLI